MCFYILRLPVCGHAPYSDSDSPHLQLILHTFCRAFESELQRIHEDPDTAWSTSTARASIPFTEPPSCAPRWAAEKDGGNVFVEWEGFCGIECENSFVNLDENVGLDVEAGGEDLICENNGDDQRDAGGSTACGHRGSPIPDLDPRWRAKMKRRRLARGEKGATFGVKREGIGWR